MSFLIRSLMQVLLYSQALNNGIQFSGSKKHNVTREISSVSPTSGRISSNQPGAKLTGAPKFPLSNEELDEAIKALAEDRIPDTNPLVVRC